MRPFPTCISLKNSIVDTLGQENEAIRVIKVLFARQKRLEAEQRPLVMSVTAPCKSVCFHFYFLHRCVDAAFVMSRGG